MRSPLLPLFLTVFVDVMGLTLVLPLLPYYAQAFGATPLQVGLLTASYSVCQLLSGPLLGHLSDRMGRKPVLLGSQLGTLVGFSVLAMAGNLPMLFIGRVIDGATAGNLTIAQAYISDVTKPEERTKTFALIGIAFGLGFLVGPAASGLLARHHGYAAPAWVAAGLSALSVLLTATLLPEVKAKSKGAGRSFAFGRFFKVPEVRTRLIAFFGFIVSFSTLLGGLALFLERRFHFDVAQTGYVFAFSGLMGGLVQGGIGRLVTRLGEFKLAAIGLLLMTISHSTIGFAHTVPFLLAMTALGSWGNAVVRPCLTTMISRSVSPDEQGAALGVSQSLGSLAQIIGPIVAGVCIQQDKLFAYGLASGFFCLVGLLVHIGRVPSTEEPATEATSP